MLGFILWFGLTAGLQEGSLLTQGRTYELPPISIAIDVHASSGCLDIYGIYTCDMSNDGTLMRDANGDLKMADGYKVLVQIEDYAGDNSVAALF